MCSETLAESLIASMQPGLVQSGAFTFLWQGWSNEDKQDVLSHCLVSPSSWENTKTQNTQSKDYSEIPLESFRIALGDRK